MSDNRTQASTPPTGETVNQGGDVAVAVDAPIFAMTGAGAILVAGNPRRVRLIIHNVGANPLRVMGQSVVGEAPATTTGYPIANGTSDNNVLPQYTGPVWLQGNGGATTVRITEVLSG